MKTIKLFSLHIEGFRGFTDFTLRPDGRSITVRGANGTGKSTLMAAFLWLLTGKDAQGRANYQIFPNARDGKRNFGFSPSVEAVLDIDGMHMTLRRTVTEKWTAHRGSVKKEYVGDETQYVVDDAPVSAARFAERVAALVPEKLLPLLLNAAWFSEQTKDHRERRNLLLEQFGGLSQADVIAANSDLCPLAELLGRHSVEEYASICTTRRKKCREAMTSLPARIDENRKQIHDVPDAAALQKERASCNVEIARLRYDMEHLSAHEVRREKENELERVRTALSAIPAKRRIVELGASDEWRQAQDRRLDKVREEQELCEEAVRTYRADLRTYESDLADATRRRDGLRKQWIDLNAQEPPADEICPTCGQALPEEMVRAAQEKFNIDRSARLDSIAKEGAEASAWVDECTALIEQTKQSLDEAEKKQASAAQALSLIKAEAPPAVRPELSKDLDEEERTLKAREAELLRGISDSSQAAKDEAQAMQAHLDELQSRSDALTAKLAEVEHNTSLQKRIAELEQEMRDTLCQLEEAEQGLALCQAYFTAQANMLTDRVNQHFQTVRFVLFETQKNGGLREICEVSVNGVLYGTLNTAAKAQANLEIVWAFGESAGVTVPLFLDGRESVTNLTIPDGMQIINLKVDEAATALQTEGV